MALGPWPLSTPGDSRPMATAREGWAVWVQKACAIQTGAVPFYLLRLMFPRVSAWGQAGPLALGA